MFAIIMSLMPRLAWQPLKRLITFSLNRNIWMKCMQQLQRILQSVYVHNVHVWFYRFALQWHHNERDSVKNHRRLDCLLNCLFRRRSKKIQCSASLAFVRDIHQLPVNSPHEEPVTRKMFPFDDVTMVPYYYHRCVFHVGIIYNCMRFIIIVF